MKPQRGIIPFRLVNWVTIFILSLLSDSNQRPRDYKSRSRPGGFEGSWPCKTCPSFFLSGCKGRHFFLIMQTFQWKFCFFMAFYLIICLIFRNFAPKNLIS